MSSTQIEITMIPSLSMKIKEVAPLERVARRDAVAAARVAPGHDRTIPKDGSG
jgi:hypothetical protein